MSKCSVCFHCGSSGISAFRKTGRVRNDFAHPVEEGLEENTEEGNDETVNENIEEESDNIIQKEVGRLKRIKGTGGEPLNDIGVDDRLTSWILPTEMSVVQDPLQLRELVTDEDGNTTWQVVPDPIPSTIVTDFTKKFDTDNNMFPEFEQELKDEALLRGLLDIGGQSPDSSIDDNFSKQNSTQSVSEAIPDDITAASDGDDEGWELSGEPPITAYGESPVTEDLFGEDLSVGEPLVPYGTEDFNVLDVSELFEAPIKEMLLTSNDDSSIADTEPEAGAIGYELLIDINTWNEVFSGSVLELSVARQLSIDDDWDNRRNNRVKRNKARAKISDVLSDVMEDNIPADDADIPVTAQVKQRDEDRYDDIFSSVDVEQEVERIQAFVPEGVRELTNRVHEQGTVIQRYSDFSVVDIGTGEIVDIGILEGRQDRLDALNNLDILTSGDLEEPMPKGAGFFLKALTESSKLMRLRNDLELGRVLSDETDEFGNQFFIPRQDLGLSRNTTQPIMGKNGQLFWPGLSDAVRMRVATALSSEGSALMQSVMEQPSAWIDQPIYSIFTGSTAGSGPLASDFATLGEPFGEGDLSLSGIELPGLPDIDEVPY